MPGDLPSLTEFATTQSLRPLIVEIPNADTEVPAVGFNYLGMSVWATAAPLVYDDGTVALAVTVRGWLGTKPLAEQTILFGPMFALPPP